MQHTLNLKVRQIEYETDNFVENDEPRKSTIRLLVDVLPENVHYDFVSIVEYSIFWKDWSENLEDAKGYSAFVQFKNTEVGDELQVSYEFEEYVQKLVRHSGSIDSVAFPYNARRWIFFRNITKGFETR